VRAVLAAHASVTFAHAQWALAAGDLVPLQGGHTPQDMPPLVSEHPTRRWLSSLALAAMCCPRLTLASFADIAGFCGVRALIQARIADPATPGLIYPGAESPYLALGQFGDAGFVFDDASFSRFGHFPGAERAQRRCARAQNRAKRVRGAMGVNSPSMKTHRATQGLRWCIETRVRILAFVLWTRR